MSTSSTFSPDPFDELALGAIERLVEVGDGDVLVCGDVQPQACLRFAQTLGQRIDCLSFRYDVACLFHDEPADPFIGLNPNGYAHLVVLQRKSKPRTLAILKILESRIQADELTLIGHKKRGIKSMPALLGEHGIVADSLGNANHCTAFRLSGFANGDDGSATSARLDADGVEFLAQPGVFGSRGLDQGSAELLDVLPKLPAGSRLLDVGCGTGVLGLSQVSSSPGSTLVAVDSDWFAVESARHNAAEQSLSDRVEVVWGDTYPPNDERFDRIVTNPPFHSGSARSYEVAQRLIAEAPRRLVDRGELWLVANRFLPYPEFLDEAFAVWVRYSESSKYTVYRATNDRRGAAKN